MRTFILTVALFLMVPALRAQQDEPKETQAQVAPQEATQNSNVQNDLPPSLRPGHPLDPADVDILTGKRDREMEAARRGIPLVVGGYYGAYAGPYEVSGQRGEMFDLPLLPLRRIDSSFFFFGIQPRGFAHGFGRGRFR